MNAQASRPQIKKSVIHGTITAILFVMMGGALIAMNDGSANLGVTMFLLLPAATGFVTALTVRYGWAVMISLQIAMFLCLACLVFTGLEGIVCVAMATPILAVSAMLGAGVGVVVRQFLSMNRTLSLAIAPILAGGSLMGSANVENSLDAGPRTEIVESTVTLQASPQIVWEAIMEFDDVQGPLPLLMRMGLPIPQSCSMQGAGVGSERTCHFSSGSIRERVTRWEEPEYLELAIEEVQLPGRHWLGFQQATYSLQQTPWGGTKVTRTTTVTSTLRPALYWRFFEHLGARTEHDFILNSLHKKVASTAN